MTATRFRYTAVDARGREARGHLDATNDVELELRLKRMGLDLVTCRPGFRLTPAWRRHSRITRAELATFCFDMEQMTRCGIPLLDGLKDVRDAQSNRRMGNVLGTVSEDLESGKLLSECLATHAEVFDAVFVSLVRAGEQTGRLAEVFESLAASLKWQDELASHARRLMINPAVVASVLCAVVAFMLLYLVPQVATLLRTMAIPLPVQTRALIATSDAVSRYWPMIVGMPVLLLAAIRWTVRHNREAAYAWDRFKLRLPVTGPIVQKIVLARFARFFALMYESGISVLDALRTSESIAHNRCIALGLERAGQQVSAGTSLTESFRNLDLFPPLVVRMLRLGETTGALDAALRNVNYFYTRDVRESVDRAMKVLEPALTLCLGAFLAVILWSVLSPVYQILGHMRF
jgi:type IV pilus assembly protein PilC